MALSVRHHGFSHSSLYKVTPEQAQGNPLIEFPGVRVSQIWGDTPLVLCQPGSQGTVLAFSSRRRHGDPLYLGRAVTTGPHTRGRSLYWGVWTWSAPPRNPHPAAQECLPQCGTACYGVQHARQPCTSYPSP